MFLILRQIYNKAKIFFIRQKKSKKKKKKKKFFNPLNNLEYILLLLRQGIALKKDFSLKKKNTVINSIIKIKELKLKQKNLFMLKISTESL